MSFYVLTFWHNKGDKENNKQLIIINDMTHTQKCMLTTLAHQAALHINTAWRSHSVKQRKPVKTVQYTVSPFTTVTAHLIFDWSNIALLSPVDRVWKIELHVWRQVGWAISWSVVFATTQPVHQLCKLSCLLHVQQQDCNGTLRNNRWPTIQ